MVTTSFQPLCNRVTLLAAIIPRQATNSRQAPLLFISCQFQVLASNSVFSGWMWLLSIIC
jgi:hypothetical protein